MEKLSAEQVGALEALLERTNPELYVRSYYKATRFIQKTSAVSDGWVASLLDRSLDLVAPLPSRQKQSNPLLHLTSRAQGLRRAAGSFRQTFSPAEALQHYRGAQQFHFAGGKAQALENQAAKYQRLHDNQLALGYQQQLASGIGPVEALRRSDGSPYAQKADAARQRAVGYRQQADALAGRFGNPARPSAPPGEWDDLLQEASTSTAPEVSTGATPSVDTATNPERKPRGWPTRQQQVAVAGGGTLGLAGGAFFGRDKAETGTHSGQPSYGARA